MALPGGSHGWSFGQRPLANTLKIAGARFTGKGGAASQAGVAWRPQPNVLPYGAGPVLAGGNRRETFSEERKKREGCSSQSLWLRRPCKSGGWGDTSFPLLVFRAQDNSAPAGRQSCLGEGLCRSKKGLLSGTIMKKKKKGRIYIFFLGSFILGLILNL